MDLEDRDSKTLLMVARKAALEAMISESIYDLGGEHHTCHLQVSMPLKDGIQ
jgi:hypothetical protein